MERELPRESVVAAIDPAECQIGELLRPLEPLSEVEERVFKGWDAPLAPWGGFRLPSGLAAVRDGDRVVLAFNGDGNKRTQERALVTRATFRDGRIRAQIKAADAAAGPHNDRADCDEAFVGIVFRAATSRWYYEFGIEGRRRAVLYRRRDDEWTALAEQHVEAPAGWVELEVRLDGDAIRCLCPELGVDLCCTDTAFRAGKVGVRSLNSSLLASLSLTQTPVQRARDDQRRTAARAARQQRAVDVPDAVLVRTYDLSSLGGRPLFADFAVEGRRDLLVQGADKLTAATHDGQPLWELPFGVSHIVFSKTHGEKGRLLFGCTGVRRQRQVLSVRGETSENVVNDEMVVIRGGDGAVLARKTLPAFPPTTRQPDFSPRGAAFTGPEGTDIVLREWREDKGGGGVRLWAYDRELNLLWHHEQTGAWYGHHWALALHDVDGDGYDELLAGGVMYDRSGRVLWVHDRRDEVTRIPGAQHYDAVELGNLAGDAETDPVAFLLAGSAGLYVVDALCGETRAVHRIGHAQGRYTGRMRSDLPGAQVLTATRWGNMGILSLFSGRGERLWTIQPDYVGQGARPLTWPGSSTQLIWTNTSARAQALRDGFGRKVRDLEGIRRLFGTRMRRELDCDVVNVGTAPTDYLAVRCDGRLHLFGPEG